MSLSSRKDAHLDICLGEEVESGRGNGLSELSLEYDALPELDLAEVDLRTRFLGKELSAPLMIGAMTGGTVRAQEINRRLARGAARVGVGMALGSQRAMHFDPELAATFRVRDVAPSLPLLMGNIGAVQLNLGLGTAEVEALVAAVGADGINLHLNPLQEAIQPEGDTQFRGLTGRIGALAAALSVPVMVKEVGAGISAVTARKLAGLPIAGVEVAGVGGTSWAKVESYRAAEADVRRAAGQALAGFGVSTAESLRICRAQLPESFALVASGGIRTGMELAVALALGADVVAVARPLLSAAESSEDAVVALLESLIYQLRVICFCAGVRRPSELRGVRVLGAATGSARRAPKSEQ